MSDVGNLISGYKTFKATEYRRYKDMIGHIIQLDMKPKTLIVACCDMRMAPATILSANPGDLYVIRNIGGFIPPYQENNLNSTIAAIDYAVKDLEVENIIVLGHKNCDAVKLLMRMEDKDVSPPMKEWLSIAEAAKNAVIEQMSDKTPAEKEEACAQESILVSLRNLLSYPLVNKSIEEEKIKLFGWQIDMKHGFLHIFNPSAGVFEAVE